mmetsp:Transcript_45114/g.125498  ORF Transcript_45114/g.125498 Transcript_45114/m.125498 type:complete len:305 (+) Transcript_45114:161-1075(+)
MAPQTGSHPAQWSAAAASTESKTQSMSWMRACLLGVASSSASISRLGDSSSPRPAPRPPRPRPPRPRPAASRHFICRSFSRLSRIFSISTSSEAMALAACFSATFFSLATSLPCASSVALSFSASISFSPWSLNTLFIASFTSLSFFFASSIAFLAASCSSCAAFRAASSSCCRSQPWASSSKILTAFALSMQLSLACCVPLAASILAIRAARSFSRATVSLRVAVSTLADASSLSRPAASTCSLISAFSASTSAILASHSATAARASSTTSSMLRPLISAASMALKVALALALALGLGSSASS